MGRAMKILKVVALVATLVCGESSARLAHADGDDRTVYADFLFTEGVRLMKEDHCAEAIPKFLSSNRLDVSSASLMNLGTCYARIGRTASAWHSYREAAVVAETEHDSALKEQALDAISQLTPRLTKLRILTPSGSPAMSLTLNGEPLKTADDSAVPLDPGENIVEASAPGRKRWRRNVSASDVGATIVIEVPELSPQPPDTDPQASRRTVAIVIGGVGASTIVTGLVLGVSAKVTYDKSDGECGASYCSQRGHELRSQALDRAALATYAVAAGAAITAVGLAVWLTTPAPQANKRFSLVPWVPVAGGPYGASFEGRM